jgi:predicted 2-oxoglutarate/Fe(II)-dependent dioxygenase YbiX
MKYYQVTTPPRIVPNVLTKEQCEKIIASGTNYVVDELRRDLQKQDQFSDKETILSRTESRGVLEKHRKIKYSEIDPVFDTWEGNPVYTCKLIKYETGDHVSAHRDSQWMCLSNYWKPNTNLKSEKVVVIPLNDDYEGGQFIADGNIIPQQVGTAIELHCDPFSPETSPVHGVTKITKGTRYSLVSWSFS